MGISHKEQIDSKTFICNGNNNKKGLRNKSHQKCARPLWINYKMLLKDIKILNKLKSSYFHE